MTGRDALCKHTGFPPNFLPTLSNQGFQAAHKEKTIQRGETNLPPLHHPPGYASAFCERPWQHSASWGCLSHSTAGSDCTRPSARPWTARPSAYRKPAHYTLPAAGSRSEHSRNLLCLRLGRRGALGPMFQKNFKYFSLLALWVLCSGQSACAVWASQCTF